MQSFLIYIPKDKNELCSLFDERQCTEEQITFEEFQNRFNPSLKLEKYAVIINSLESYTSQKNDIIYEREYNKFINKMAQSLATLEPKGWRGPVDKYLNEAKMKYPRLPSNDESNE